MSTLMEDILDAQADGKELLAVLIDPDKFDPETTTDFLDNIPKQTTHLLVGGSTVPKGKTQPVVKSLKQHSNLPVLLFPGSYDQLTPEADGLLFLSLLSGRNPEYLIGQQLKAVPFLRDNDLEVIPTAYLLIDGGTQSAVAKVTQTKPMDPNMVGHIVDTAKAGQLMGAGMVYLEAGSGAAHPVPPQLIEAVDKDLDIPLIVGGGIRTMEQRQTAYQAGATMVVIGTALEQS